MSKANELDHSRPLDVHRRSDHSEANGFVDNIYSKFFSGYTGNERIAKRHVKVVLLDLYVAWKSDPDLKIHYSRNNNDYKRDSRYNELHISKKTPEIADRLAKYGLVGTALGFYDRTEGGSSRVSRMWPTGKLIEMFEEARFGPLDICDHPGRECIILRDRDKNDIEYEDNRTTRNMRKVVKDYNGLIADTYIDIPTLIDPRIPLGPDHRTGNKFVYVNQSDKFTRRIFNRSSFEKGGRFYGGWWQRTPKEYRAKIFMDDQPTSEIDFSGLHIVLLYAKEGINYWEYVDEDPYALPRPSGLPEDIDYRSLCKSILLVAVNAKNEEAAFSAFRSNAEPGSFEKHLTNKQLGTVLNQLRHRHAAIGKYFASDAGIDLMYVDSQITSKIVEYLTDLRIPVLCVHDSYIVPAGCENKLARAMQRAFASVSGVQTAVVDPQFAEPGSVKGGEKVDRYKSLWGRFKKLKGKSLQPAWTDHGGLC